MMLILESIVVVSLALCLLYLTLYRFFLQFHGWTTGSEALNGADLNGKCVLITGATSGIGKETAKILMYANAPIVIACRNLTKGTKVKQQLLSHHQATKSNSQIILVQLDLQSLKSGTVPYPLFLYYEYLYISTKKPKNQAKIT